jgi:hypothetical protein
MTTAALVPRTDAELAGLDELVFILHAVTAGMPVLADSLCRPCGTDWSTRGMRSVWTDCSRCAGAGDRAW